jgi:hypothetical protein
MYSNRLAQEKTDGSEDCKRFSPYLHTLAMTNMNDLSSNRTRRALAVSFLSVALASCGGGDPASETLQTSKTMENALGSLSQGLAVETEAPAHQVTHSRFIRRMRAEHANNNPLAAKAHLDSLMWHVGDLRKYGAIPDEYAVPLNTALHYVAQLYGTRRAEKARQLGDPPVTAAEFESAVAQLRALVAAAGQGSTPRAARMLALVTEDSTGCNTMGEIGEDVGVVLAAGLKSIPEVGQVFSALTSIFWPINCTESATEALQDQLNALKAEVANVNWNIYNSTFNDLKGPAFTYRDTVQFSSDAPSILRDLRAALTAYLDKKAVLLATGTSDYSAAAALPLYAAYVTQYIALLQDYINNAAAGGECGTASKWCDPLETDAGRNQQMCAWKKELLRVTYDYTAGDPDPKIMILSECYDALSNPKFEEIQIYKADSAKQYVIATMKNGTGIIPAATVSTSKPNLKMLSWNARNAWTRATTLTSQDPAMYWPWMNIIKYPPTTDLNDPTVKVANEGIPAAVLTRELYSDIIGVIHDVDIQTYSAPNDVWPIFYTQQLTKEGVNTADDWFNKIVQKYQAYPYYGPITTVEVFGEKGNCASACGDYGSRVWDIRTTYAPLPNSINGGPFGGAVLPYTSPGISNFIPTGGSSDQNSGVKANGMKFSVTSTHPLYSFTARVITDQDTSPARPNIPGVQFYFNNGGYTGFRPADPGSDSALDGHVYSAPDLATGATGQTIFGIPGHIISQITPYGRTWADKAYVVFQSSKYSVNAFIVGYRPYNAWGN